jgi:hypothetical protein
MIVKELKERLEILIEEDKADYKVYEDEECVIYINDKDKEVYV